MTMATQDGDFVTGFGEENAMAAVCIKTGLTEKQKKMLEEWE